jgi:hypothetical protein
MSKGESAEAEPAGLWERLFVRKPAVKQATLGDDNTMFYDEKLKRWIDPGAPEEAGAGGGGLPPPPITAPTGESFAPQMAAAAPSETDDMMAPPPLRKPKKKKPVTGAHAAAPTNVAWLATAHLSMHVVRTQLKVLSLPCQTSASSHALAAPMPSCPRALRSGLSDLLNLSRSLNLAVLQPQL